MFLLSPMVEHTSVVGDNNHHFLPWQFMSHFVPTPLEFLCYFSLHSIVVIYITHALGNGLFRAVADHSEVDRLGLLHSEVDGLGLLQTTLKLFVLWIVGDSGDSQLSSGMKNKCLLAGYDTQVGSPTASKQIQTGHRQKNSQCTVQGRKHE